MIELTRDQLLALSESKMEPYLFAGEDDNIRRDGSKDQWLFATNPDGDYICHAPEDVRDVRFNETSSLKEVLLAYLRSDFNPRLFRFQSKQERDAWLEKVS